MTTAAGAHDQQLVVHYVGSVFMSFLVGLLAIAPFARRECRHKSFVINLIGAIVVAFTLIVNPGRGKPRGIASTPAAGHTTDRARSSAIRRAIAASDEMLDCDRVRYGDFTLVSVS